MKKELIAVGTITFILKLIYLLAVYLVNPEGVFVFDSWGYLNLAHNIYHEGIFSQYTDGSLIPDSTRTPLYPLFISLFHWLGLNEWAILIAQVFFWCISSIVLYLTCIELGLKKKLALAAGLILAIDPVSSYFASVIMTESLFCMLLLIGVYCLIKERLIISGMVFGLAILCRPIALYLPLLLVVFILIKQKENSIQKLAKSVFYFGLPILLLILHWGIRNKTVFGEFFLSSITEVNLLFHTATNIKAQAAGLDAKAVEMDYREQLLGDLNWNETSSIPTFRARSRDEFYSQLINEPFVFMKIYSRSFLMFFIKPMRSYFDQQLKLGSGGQISGVMNKVPGFKEISSNTSNLALVLVGIQSIIILFLIIGATGNVFGSELNKNGLILLGLLILYFAASSSLSEVDARFRLPAFPFMIILGLSSRMISKRII